jgi:predicted secreted protein
MATQGFGIQLAYESSGSYVTVGEITDVTPPSFSKDTIETTHHASTGGIRTFVGGLVDTGEASLEVNYGVADAGHVFLRDAALAANDAPTNFKITYSDSADTTETFAAIVTGFEASSPMDDRMTATITLKVSGGIAYA